MKRIRHIAFLVVLAASAAGFPSVAYADDGHVEAVAANDCTAVPVGGGIVLSSAGNATFEVYSITGQKVKSVAVDSGSVKVELPKGCYIVRCPQWSKKVIVK